MEVKFMHTLYVKPYVISLNYFFYRVYVSMFQNALAKKMNSLTKSKDKVNQ